MDELGLAATPVGHLPFPLYQQAEINLLLTGSGAVKAGTAVSLWLSHYLRDLGLAHGAGLLAPPLVVANFGTAGADARAYEIGQTLLVHRVQDELGPSLYPERLVPWDGVEGECRTVARPRTKSDEKARLYDMEAFAISEATATFLSTSHLVVGKCVSDHLGEPLDWKALAQRCQNAYRQGALRFLQHAQTHARTLEEDGRRLRSVEIAEQTCALLEEALARLPLTVTQQRELTQYLKARLAEDRDKTWVGEWLKRLPSCIPADKREVKAALISLLAL